MKIIWFFFLLNILLIFKFFLKRGIWAWFEQFVLHLYRFIIIKPFVLHVQMGGF